MRATGGSRGFTRGDQARGDTNSKEEENSLPLKTKPEDPESTDVTELLGAPEAPEQTEPVDTPKARSSLKQQSLRTATKTVAAVHLTVESTIMTVFFTPPFLCKGHLRLTIVLAGGYPAARFVLFHGNTFHFVHPLIELKVPRSRARCFNEKNGC